MRTDENLFHGPAPAVGDLLSVKCRGRQFDVEIVWGNWEFGVETDRVIHLRAREL
ncbi:hypothetical protein [Rhizobium sp. FKL33]|uniref:hypothetical protein n=1 Tax=Rhizobium sp. FKL33 TaxID=2562307 RepID=UPI0014857BB0|nr:hypothetical protein [Rhizobium sp. FKL33]